MKRRSQKEPPRDRELEQVREMTTVSLTTTEMYQRLRADKLALEGKINRAHKARNEIRKLCAQHVDPDPEIVTTRMAGKASVLFAHYADRIKTLTAQLRAVKEQLMELDKKE